MSNLMEIAVPRTMCKDPNLPERFEGTVVYRGETIPVVNLKKVLKMPGSPGRLLIIIKNTKGVLGLLADTASELLESAQRPAPLPRGLMDQDQNYYTGILRHREDLVLLLNENSLLP